MVKHFREKFDFSFLPSKLQWLRASNLVLVVREPSKMNAVKLHASLGLERVRIKWHWPMVMDLV